MPFSLKALDSIADRQSLIRGRDYFFDGKVHDFAHLDEKSGQVLVTGRVMGSKRYAVTLRIDPAHNAVVRFTCSCPYHFGGACKHVVALGLAYADFVSTKPPSPEISDQTLDILNQFFRDKKVKVNQASLLKLVSQLSKGKSTLPVATEISMSPIIRRYPLKKISITISYDAVHDGLRLMPEASYGKWMIPVGSDGIELEGEEPPIKGRRVLYRIERDWEVEWQCRYDLHIPVEMPLDEQGVFLRGDDIYTFVKEILPDALYAYEVIIDPSAKHLVVIEEDDVTSEWKTGSTGIDFLEFEAAWHCANSQIRLEQLEKMVEEGKPYIRRPDGSFVEFGNVEDIKHWLDFLKGATSKGGGKFTTKLFRVPEMVNLIEHVGSSQLTAMDGYVKTFLQETQTGKLLEPIHVPVAISNILRPYQKRGVDWGMFLKKYHFGGILADDMGLGKTLQALTLLSLDHQEKTMHQPSIVICPKTLISVWMAEAAHFFPKLKTLAIQGSAEERNALMKRTAKVDLVITSYPLMLRDIQTYHKRKATFRYCLLDEAQYIKNADSETAQAVKLIPAEFRLALSGTPIENGVHELWSIFDFLMPGFLGDRVSFRTRFQRPIQERHDTEALELLKAKTQPFILRRTKAMELKDLPPKIEQVRECQLTPEQLMLYSQTLEAVKRDVLEAVERKGFKHAQIEILAALMRLRQVCNHPALVLKNSNRDPSLSGKMPCAMEIIQEAIEGSHKILLFSSFTSMLDIIREELDAKKIGHCTIEGKTRDRAGEVKRFCEDSSKNVFLLSLKAGGVGLTLTAADTVIVFDPWWNPMAETQATDRAHRIGQTKSVNVYRLITKGTIEERVLELQQRKRKLFDALMDEHGEALEALTWDDMKGLFEM